MFNFIKYSLIQLTENKVLQKIEMTKKMAVFWEVAPCSLV
jgi:hypothetical protein